MSRTLRVEWLKLRTTRLYYGLFALAVALTGLDALLRSARAGHGKLPPLNTAEGLARPLTVTGFAVLTAGILGIALSSGEFRHGTATLTYLSFPRRLSVLAAKLGVGSVAGALVGAGGAVATTAIALAFAAGRGYPISLSLSTIVGDGAGAAFAGSLLAAIGVALGSLVRSQVGAIIATFVWAFFVEAIVGGVFNGIDPYLPFTAATTLAGSGLGGGGFGFAGSVSATALPFLAATALLLLVIGGLSAVAAATTVRQDIT